MADNNTETPAWVIDAEHFAKQFSEPQVHTKSITFDYKAQANLPQWVKDKMKANKEKARGKNKT